MLLEALFREGANPRVDDGFEFFARRGVAKNDFPEFLAVDSSVWLEDFRAEGVDNFSPALLIGLDDLAR